MTPNDELINFLNTNAISPDRLAEVLGVTQGAVRHWRSNRRDVPVVVIRLIRWFSASPPAMEYFERLGR